MAYELLSQSRKLNKGETGEGGPNKSGEIGKSFEKNKRKGGNAY